ncbi:GNAT family N-acetyltransferase [Sorangium sp. So ce854]|uniref:GNAT family N-acetyltransferase n=1 Tax=Sorangium sp. So ce854 TaxID=3133322 RepID=UPI003F5DE762
MGDDDAVGDDDVERRLRAVHAELVAERVIDPLAMDDAETRLWIDCELASLVENRFFERVDPAARGAELRAVWASRATRDGIQLGSPHAGARYVAPYWLVHEGRRVGTIALSTGGLGGALLEVSSLYVLPAHRGRGAASAALRRAGAAARARGAPGLRVRTPWAWQGAVRFYLGLGMWVAGWADAIELAWRRGLPAHDIEIGGAEATFCVVVDGRKEHLVRASREGDRLGWAESPRMEAHRGERSDVARLGPATFAVALAARGFPLVRSEDRWRARRDPSSAGEPEGLARAIELFEAVDRSFGFDVRAPRIPGLRYRAYEDID